MFEFGLVWLSVSMYSVVLQHLPSVCLKPTSKNDQVTVDYLNDLIGDIGVMSLDKKITPEEADAVTKTQIFFKILSSIPSTMLNMDKHKIIKSVKSVTIDTIGPNVNIMEIPFQCFRTW